jgi:uncharacterized membrane protein YhaH (DUF805 family)
MRGEVLRYSDAEGQGLISGDDGVRYSFVRGDLAQLAPVRAGMRVDFKPEGEHARDIVLLEGQGSPAASAAAMMTNIPANHPSTAHHLGVWGYFSKCMNMYVDGGGRATRGEYWSFVLMNMVFVGIPLIVGLATAGYEFYEYGGSPEPVAIGFWIVAALATLAFILPGICVAVRRLHDLGMSGWLYLRGFIPYVGGLFLLVISLLPGQNGPNVHGPDPQTIKRR